MVRVLVAGSGPAGWAAAAACARLRHVDVPVRGPVVRTSDIGRGDLARPAPGTRPGRTPRPAGRPGVLAGRAGGTGADPARDTGSGRPARNRPLRRGRRPGP